MIWQPLDPLIEERVGRVLESWRGTPYMLDQQKRGWGVDCVRFVCAALDEIYGRKQTPTEKLPPDASMHSPESARKVMGKILRRYRPNYRVTDNTLEPGDVVVTGPSGGGPGHAMIVGTKRGEIWHIPGPNHEVCTSGMPKRVFEVRRARDKQKWHQHPS